MFTLDTTRQPPSLTSIFKDTLQPAIEANPDLQRTSSTVMTFLYYGKNVDVTILVSKKNGRYRLQSGNFEALYLISQQLVDRLTQYFAKESPKTGPATTTPDEQLADSADTFGPFNINFKELLPLHDYYSIIDRHFEERTRMEEHREKLEKAAHQFRVIQKRLLVRFKDKNPSPLQQLDTMLEETYNQILELGAKMDKSKVSLRELSLQLSSATSLMLLLIRFKYDLDEANMNILKYYFSPRVNDNSEQGWEETIDIAITQLLKTVLAKVPKEVAVVQPIAPMKDTSKLKKHIHIVCDRLGKGARLIRNTQPKAKKP